tara:strand:+ start:101 stop:502 length:402 start_codon:yes stop_codon:yes gene_type:complete
MTKKTKALQIKTVERILSLRKNGANLADAKAIVASEFNVSVYKLTQWFKKHGPRTTTPVTRTTVHTQDYSFNDMSTGVRGVLRSIINQDGQYTIKEANAVGKLYSAEISKAKVLIDVHKLNTKSNDNNTLRLN